MNSLKKKEEKNKKVYWGRPWNEWVVWIFWFIFEIVFLQATIASISEYEPRASLIYGGIFVSVLFAGVVAWFVRKNRLI